MSTEDRWDEFIYAASLGQYQQSATWARYKQSEGWQVHRQILQGAGGVAGGYQLLWRRKKFLRIGYVSKGPVTRGNSPEVLHTALACLKEDTLRLRLSALVLQLPDDAPRDYQDQAVSMGFVTCNPARVIETTLRVDVIEGVEAIHSRMSKNTHRHLRLGLNRGIVIREGTEMDLPVFFRLMQASCLRQNEKPNPASLELLRQIWVGFSARKSIRMTLALSGGKPIAGQISIGHGHCLCLWKKGWDGSDSRMYPSLLLEDECLQWAHAAGFRFCDFGSLDANVAKAIMEGRQPSMDSLRQRDVFNLKFGGVPKFLPLAMAYSPNRLTHALLRVRGFVERLIG